MTAPLPATVTGLELNKVGAEGGSNPHEVASAVLESVATRLPPRVTVHALPRWPNGVFLDGFDETVRPMNLGQDSNLRRLGEELFQTSLSQIIPRNVDSQVISRRQDNL